MGDKLMIEAPWWVFFIMLLLIPLAIVLLFFAHKNLPKRLLFFLISGFIVNHWLHVWCYRLNDKISVSNPETKLNLLFAFSIDWKISLLLGFSERFGRQKMTM